MAKEAKTKAAPAPRKWPCREKTGTTAFDGSCLQCDAPRGKKCKGKSDG